MGNARENANTPRASVFVAVAQMTSKPETLVSESRECLLEKARQGEILVIDVRPVSEFSAGHLPFARSMPLAEIEQRLSELPHDKEIVAYCRGPFCVLSDDAVALLGAHGFRVKKTLDGVSEWKAAGLRNERASA